MPPSEYVLAAIRKLRIDPLAGKVYRADKEVGTIDPTRGGRCVVKVGGRKGRTVQRYQIIWYLMVGEWPEDTLDHRDNDHLNDALPNLQECSRAENASLGWTRRQYASQR